MAENEEAQESGQESVLDKIAAGMPPGLFPDEEEGTAEAEQEAEEVSAEEPETGDQSDIGEEDESEEDEPLAAQVIEVDGEEKTLEELKQGYMRTKDYTQKQQKRADRERDLDQREREMGAIFQASKSQQMQELQRYQQIPWAQLQTDDPARYDQLRTQFQTAYQAAQAIEQREQQFIQAYRTQRQKIATQEAQDARAELENTLPGGWSEEVYSTLRAHAVSEGMDQARFDQITDPALIRMAWKAQQYDAGRQKLANPKGKPAAKKPAPKGRKAAQSKKVAAKQRQADLRKRARKTQKSEDLAAWIETTLPSNITND